MLNHIKKKLLFRQEILLENSLYSEVKEHQWVYLLGMLEGLFLPGTISLLEEEKKDLLLWSVLLFDLEEEYEKQTGEKIPVGERTRLLEELENDERLSA